jgi:2-keto-4-pentenoate hydratase
VGGWLRQATRHGAELSAGSIVTTGAWLVVKGLRPGDHVRVGFDGLATVELSL